MYCENKYQWNNIAEKKTAKNPLAIIFQRYQFKRAILPTHKT